MKDAIRFLGQAYVIGVGVALGALSVLGLVISITEAIRSI